MRTVDYAQIVETVRDMCLRANSILPKDVEEAIARAHEKEVSPVGRSVLGTMLENAEIARERRMALCQDTGMVVVFADVGQDVHITGGLLSEAINEGVRQGYKDFYFRNSVVRDPLERVKTQGTIPLPLCM